MGALPVLCVFSPKANAASFSKHANCENTLLERSLRGLLHKRHRNGCGANEVPVVDKAAGSSISVRIQELEEAYQRTRSLSPPCIKS